jgi:hypothetical protein
MCLLLNPFLHDGRPKSILACLDRSTGAIDQKKFNSYIGFRGDEHQHNINTTTAQAYYSLDSRFRDVDVAFDVVDEPPVKKKRRAKCVMARQMDSGELERIKPTESFWYSYYIQNPLLEDSKFLTKFRGRFRLPYRYSQFEELVG